MEFIKCPKCHKKLFKVGDFIGDVEIKCHCGKIIKITGEKIVNIRATIVSETVQK